MCEFNQNLPPTFDCRNDLLEWWEKFVETFERYRSSSVKNCIAAMFMTESIAAMAIVQYKKFVKICQTKGEMLAYI